MVRGRRQDPTAQPSRQLEISRAFRQRRAKDIQNLRDLVTELQNEAQQLREENQALREKNHSLMARPRSSLSAGACGRCHELQTELDCIKFQVRSMASSQGCCSTVTTASKASSCKPSTQASPAPAPPHASAHPASPAYSQAPRPSVAASHSLSSMSPSSSTPPSTFMPPTPHAVITPYIPPFDLRNHPPHPHSAPGTDAPPAVQRLWEDSVRQSGGDPNKCCAGFFECDQQGQIIVDSPPRVP